MADPRSRAKTGLIGVGILVIAFGFGLPRLLSTNEPTTPTDDTTPDLTWPLARLVGGLVIVCVLCVVVTRFLNRRSPAPTSSVLNLLASARVDARCGLYLVRAGERRLLLGYDASGVKALVELPGVAPEPVEVAAFQVPVPTRRF